MVHGTPGMDRKDDSRLSPLSCRTQSFCAILPGETIMKRCPFCAENVHDDAIKCKHCGEFLDASAFARFSKKQHPWYFRKSFIIIAVCSVGPLALPLIWWRPQTKRAWKIGLTIAIIFLSWILLQTTMESIRTIKEYYGLLKGL